MRIVKLKVVIVASMLLGSLGLCAQNLNAGDIAFIGWDTGTGTSFRDGYTFITLKEIPANEKILFTDKGIINSTTYIVGPEGTYLFTAPPTPIPCGTIINLRETGPTTDVVTITGVTGATYTNVEGTFNVGSGDQMMAYQNATGILSLSPDDSTFIAAIHGDYSITQTNPATGWTNSADVSSTSESIRPPGLDSTNSLALFPTGPERDNARYTGGLTGTFSELLALINNPANWESMDSSAGDVTGYDITPTAYPTPNVDSNCTTPVELQNFSVE